MASARAGPHLVQKAGRALAAHCWRCHERQQFFSRARHVDSSRPVQIDNELRKSGLPVPERPAAGLADDKAVTKAIGAGMYGARLPRQRIQPRFLVRLRSPPE